MERTTTRQNNMSNRSNSKTVKTAVAFHVCDYYDTREDLVADYNAVDGDAKKLVEGGNFLISYYEDITADLKAGETTKAQALTEQHEVIEQFKTDLMEHFNA
jgi:hypothetical protein